VPSCLRTDYLCTFYEQRALTWLIEYLAYQHQLLGYNHPFTATGTYGPSEAGVAGKVAEKSRDAGLLSAEYDEAFASQFASAQVLLNRMWHLGLDVTGPSKIFAKCRPRNQER
jgi:hypothetical protein